ncbi:hypothetical protein AAEX28_04190 [Lentisphaerota bacterium WC36G]|nr:hypothetical protein LJT99_07060 [Lentisphaerae bacterium WC36]
MFETDFKVNTSEVNSAFKKLAKVQDRTVKDIVKYNAKFLVKKLAWITLKATRANVPTKRRQRVGRARAGWFKAWEALGLTGKAYSTAAAVRIYSKEGDYKEDFTGSNNYVEIINNNKYLHKILKNSDVQKLVDDQGRKMANYADRQLNNQIGKIF